MTMAVLHYPNLHSAPKGVWWWEDGAPRLSEFYTDSALRPTGAARIGHVAEHADAVDIEEFFARLADSYPRPDVWEMVTLGEMTAPEYLRFEIRRLKKAA